MTTQQKQVSMTTQRNAIKRYASKLSTALCLGRDVSVIVKEMNAEVLKLDQLIQDLYK